MTTTPKAPCARCQEPTRRRIGTESYITDWAASWKGKALCWFCELRLSGRFQCAECLEPFMLARRSFTDIAGNDFCRSCAPEVRARAARRKA